MTCHCCAPERHRSTFSLVAEVYASLVVLPARTRRIAEGILVLEQLLRELDQEPPQ